MAFKVQDEEQGSTLSEINIIPLVDIMLILLVIFMVAAPSLLAQDERNLDVDIPQVATEVTNTDPASRILTIDKLGKLTLQGPGIEGSENLSLDTLGVALERLYAETSPEEKVLFVRADKEVPHGIVIQVIGLSRQLGIAKIGMMTQAKDQAPEDKNE